ncbi:MAG: type II CAAX endopeptidase family protein [Candidatus Baltobacteraceae bacterium]
MRNNSTWGLSRLSPTNWPPDAWNPPVTALAACGALFLAYAPGIVYLGAGIRRGAYTAGHVPPMQFLIAQAVCYVPLALYLLLAIPALARVPLAKLGFRAPARREILGGLGGAAVMWLIVAVSSALLAGLTHRHDTEPAVALLQQMKTPLQKVVFAAVAVVLAPMVEELGFRVFIFNAFTRYVDMWPAALLSGLAFGLVHALGNPGQIPTVAIPLGLGGVVLAYVYAANRCYWSSVITHGTFNAVSVIAIFFFHAT